MSRPKVMRLKLAKGPQLAPEPAQAPELPEPLDGDSFDAYAAACDRYDRRERLSKALHLVALLFGVAFFIFMALALALTPRSTP